MFTLCTKLFSCHVPPHRCNRLLGQNIFLLAVRVRQIINTELSVEPELSLKELEQECCSKCCWTLNYTF